MRRLLLIAVLIVVLVVGVILVSREPSDIERLKAFQAECLANDTYTARECRTTFVMECQNMLGYTPLECGQLWTQD